ncbi:MAG: cell division protein SepF [Fusobacterium sp. JB021]|nr:cell division protein SepF [Fusobacterium sp. JB021]MDP0506142.1 cell division protein SepF [Fusobacterium sp. JB019]
MEYDIVFLNPTRFEDCMKYVEYIKNDKIVHINLSEVEEGLKQRILDFISGAVFIQEGKIINPGKDMYCSLPKNCNYYLEKDEKMKRGKSDIYDEEPEIIPKYYQGD